MESPSWFTDALAVSPERRNVQVDGARIHYLRWGDPSHPGALLVHGGSAHAEWWSFLGPLLAQDRCIVAIDLSGHGDSEWREDYSMEQWAEEVHAVGMDAGLGEAPLVIGHSMGGVVSTYLAARRPLAGAIIVDSPIVRRDPETEEGTRGHMFHRPKVYPDVDTAVGHFHLVPPQPRTNPYILDHIARCSLRDVDAGWTWKFDPKAIGRRRVVDVPEQLRNALCRLALIVGEHSDVDRPDPRVLPEGTPVVEIPAAYHHLLLDQPIAFVVALRSLIAAWLGPDSQV